MLDRTSTSYARWTLIEAEDKRYGRVKVLETLIAALEARRQLTGYCGRIFLKYLTYD